MCNLYRLARPADEVARLFGAQPPAGANLAAEVYPGYPGLVVADGRARAMSWGFPLVLRGRQGGLLKPKPVNNAREDRLLTGFWRDSFVARRCLVPVSAWAEAEGAKGRMTRTWYALPERDVFAVAGLWRPTEAWGDAFTIVMVDGHPQMAAAHGRMPLILRRDEESLWTDGSVDQALALCRVWPDALQVERTAQRWAATPATDAQPSLL